ncbi:LysR family transcriptional regulator [Vibrio fluvialis]|nr:LysR family transcriptional regulator [Vibrio fluvialis]MCG6367787.1 LysR family transcriptional regulator [Vibrio fluvialis]MCG6376537.1 LysR family transcriptional regulator [Vibrio fluvialis]
MKLHQIKAFLAVSQAGSLKTAAEQLHLTQPALSKAINWNSSTVLRCLNAAPVV